MTATSGYLPAMLGPVVIQADGVDQTPAAALNVIGASVGYNDDTGALDIDVRGVTLTQTTLNATPVEIVLATLGVGDVKQVDVIAKVAKADGSIRQCFKLSGLYFGDTGPVATEDAYASADTGTGAALVELDVTGATVVMRITGTATTLVTTYEVHTL